MVMYMLPVTEELFVHQMEALHFKQFLEVLLLAFAAGGQGDVVISPTGKVYVAVTGAASDLTLRGIWKSTTGNLNSYTRLAGGSILGVDSVDGWRGNAYTYQLSGTEKFYDPRRTLLALALQMKIYCMYYMKMDLPIQVQAVTKKQICLN